MTTSSNNGKVRVACYARVSGEEQTIGRNIEQQVAELTNSIPPSHQLVGTYTDDGISGAIGLADRPAGSRLMQDANAGRFEEVIATKLDRMGRSVVDIRQVAEQLAALGITLKAQGLEFGPNPTGIGRLLLTLLSAIAEFERDLIKDRTLSGKRFKAKSMGRWPGGTKPYGYAYDKGEPGEDGKWCIIEGEAEVVRSIYDMCVREDLGISLIATRLSDGAIPTPSAVIANPNHPRAKPNFRVAKRWERSHLAQMLRNPAYMGKLLVAVDGERKQVSVSRLPHLIRTDEWQQTGLIEMRIPAIVSEDLWWQAQERLDARRRLPNPQYETWPLQGRVLCASDGRAFACRRNNKSGPRIYSCVGREVRAHPDGSPRCKAPRLESDRIEAAVVWHLNGLLSNPATGRRAVEDYLSSLEALQEAATKGLSPILGRLAELDGQEKRLDELYFRGRLSLEEFETRLAEVLKTRQNLEGERGQRQREVGEFETRRQEIERIRVAIAEERFSVSMLPSAKVLRVTLWKEREDPREPFNLVGDDDLDDDTAPSGGAVTGDGKRSKARVGSFKLKKGMKSFLEATVEARSETSMDLRRLFDLLDIRVIVHDKHVEVQGIFPRPVEIGVDEIGYVPPLSGETVSSSGSSSASPRLSA